MLYMEQITGNKKGVCRLSELTDGIPQSRSSLFTIGLQNVGSDLNLNKVNNNININNFIISKQKKNASKFNFFF